MWGRTRKEPPGHGTRTRTRTQTPHSNGQFIWWTKNTIYTPKSDRFNSFRVTFYFCILFKSFDIFVPNSPLYFRRYFYSLVIYLFCCCCSSFVFGLQSILGWILLPKANHRTNISFTITDSVCSILDIASTAHIFYRYIRFDIVIIWWFSYFLFPFRYLICSWLQIFSLFFPPVYSQSHDFQHNVSTLTLCTDFVCDLLASLFLLCCFSIFIAHKNLGSSCQLTLFFIFSYIHCIDYSNSKWRWEEAVCFFPCVCMCQLWIQLFAFRFSTI